MGEATIIMNELVIVTLLVLSAGALVAGELFCRASRESLETKTVSIKVSRSPLPPWRLSR